MNISRISVPIPRRSMTVGRRMLMYRQQAADFLVTPTRTQQLFPSHFRLLNK